MVAANSLPNAVLASAAIAAQKMRIAVKCYAATDCNFHYAYEIF
jgi:hypothetical protein